MTKRDCSTCVHEARSEFESPCNECIDSWDAGSGWSGYAARPQEQPTKAERVTAIVNAGPFPGMSEAFDAHMGAACWTDPAYAPDASMWAAAWKAAKGQRPAAQAVEPVAWAIFTENGNARMWSTFQPHVQKLADAEGLKVTPLYTAQPQAQPLNLRLLAALTDMIYADDHDTAISEAKALIAEVAGIGTEGGAR